MLLLSVCLRLSDDKFRENNAIICPASYSYYSTNHNDGVAIEDYFNQTENGELQNTVGLSLMLCICCGFDRPNRVLKQAVRVLVVVQKQHLTSADTM